MMSNCIICKYDNVSIDDEPCKSCIQGSTQYEPKESGKAISFDEVPYPYGHLTCSAKTAKYDTVENLTPKAKLFKEITQEMSQVYIDKNKDYGDSFSILYDKFGLESVVIRLYDKLLRLETLSKEEARVKTESIEDTLLDLANYAVMTLVELKSKEDK